MCIFSCFLLNICFSFVLNKYKKKRHSHPHNLIYQRMITLKMFTMTARYFGEIQNFLITFSLEHIYYCMQPIERRNLGTKKQITAYKRHNSCLTVCWRIFYATGKLSSKSNTDLANWILKKGKNQFTGVWQKKQNLLAYWQKYLSGLKNLTKII